MTHFPDASTFKEHEIGTNIKIRVVAGEKIMFSFLEFQPGGEIAAHSHPHEQMGTVLEGEFELTIGEETRIVRAGDTYIIPGSVPHSGRSTGHRAVTLDVFSPPREDYL